MSAKFWVSHAPMSNFDQLLSCYLLVCASYDGILCAFVRMSIVYVMPRHNLTIRITPCTNPFVYRFSTVCHNFNIVIARTSPIICNSYTERYYHKIQSISIRLTSQGSECVSNIFILLCTS